MVAVAQLLAYVTILVGGVWWTGFSNKPRTCLMMLLVLFGSASAVVTTDFIVVQWEMSRPEWDLETDVAVDLIFVIGALMRAFAMMIAVGVGGMLMNPRRRLRWSNHPDPEQGEGE